MSERASGAFEITRSHARPIVIAVALFIACGGASRNDDRHDAERGVSSGSISKGSPSSETIDRNASEGVASSSSASSSGSITVAASASAPTTLDSGRYLILGDSHLFGLFGQHLELALRDPSRRKVWLYGSCGSSPMTWIKGMETPCGGYEHSDEGKPHKTFERYRTPAVGDLLATIKPTHTIVVMGVNFLHFADSTAPHMRQILEIIRESGSECTWVGPPEIPDRTLPDGAQVKYHKLIARLYKVLAAETDGRCKLIDARDIAIRRWDTFDNVHVGPIAAKRWSDTVVASLLNPSPNVAASSEIVPTPAAPSPD